MKKLMTTQMKMIRSLAPTFIFILGFSLTAVASPTNLNDQQLYQFKFKLKGQRFEFAQKAATYEKAFEVAALACYRHFKAGKRLSEDQGLDIIDVCANPRI